MEYRGGTAERSAALSNVGRRGGSGQGGRRPAAVFERNDSGLYLSSDSSGPTGPAVWEDGTRGGVVLGALTNLDELGLTHRDVFERLLDGRTDVAAAVEGDFLIACADASEDRWVIVTDKLGARPCYYTAEEGFHFATSVSDLLSRHPDPTVDPQAVNDMLLMGHLWGTRTLVSGIRAVRPATVLEAVDGEVRSRRYWKPDYAEAAPGEAYLDDLARRYRQAVERTAGTLPREAGIWLSGGLDSRTTAATLREAAGGSNDFQTLRSYTYNANPPTNDNPRIAREVSRRLGLEYADVPLTADTFASAFERAIEATDGMLSWHILNLAATYNIERPPPVMLEGMPGELLGDHPFRYHLDDPSPVRAQYASEAGTSAERVDALLVPDVDPFETFRAEARRSTESTRRATVLDTHFQNYYARSTMLSDQVTRDRTGSRAAHVDGDYLELCARLPRRYRKGTFPFTRRFVQADAGGVPYGTSRAKLGLCRRLAPSLTDVTYERTKVRPSRPYPFHVAGFVANVGVGRLCGKATYGSGQLADFWLRDTATALHRIVTDLVDAACDRPLFDADRVRSAYDDHMNGANNVSVLAKITTVEYWLQTHLD